MKLRLFAMLRLAASYAIAQNLVLQPASSGFVFNAATSAIHPIQGIPGASVLGDPLLTGIQAASASLDGDAVVAATDKGVFAVTGLRSGTVQWQLLSET